MKKRKEKKQTCLNRVDGNTVSGLQCLSTVKVTAVDSKKTLNRKAYDSTIPFFTSWMANHCPKVKQRRWRNFIFYLAWCSTQNSLEISRKIWYLKPESERVNGLYGTVRSHKYGAIISIKRHVSYICWIEGEIIAPSRFCPRPILLPCF